MTTDDRLKALCRRAYRAGETVVELDGTSWRMGSHRVSNVTWLYVCPVNLPLPVLNFPLSQTEYDKEMKRRYDAGTHKPQHR